MTQRNSKYKQLTFSVRTVILYLIYTLVVQTSRYVHIIIEQLSVNLFSHNERVSSVHTIIYYHQTPKSTLAVDHIEQTIRTRSTTFPHHTYSYTNLHISIYITHIHIHNKYRYRFKIKSPYFYSVIYSLLVCCVVLTQRSLPWDLLFCPINAGYVFLMPLNYI